MLSGSSCGRRLGCWVRCVLRPECSRCVLLVCSRRSWRAASLFAVAMWPACGGRVAFSFCGFYSGQPVLRWVCLVVAHLYSACLELGFLVLSPPLWAGSFVCLPLSSPHHGRLDRVSGMFDRRKGFGWVAVVVVALGREGRGGFSSACGAPPRCAFTCRALCCAVAGAGASPVALVCVPHWWLARCLARKESFIVISALCVCCASPAACCWCRVSCCFLLMRKMFYLLKYNQSRIPQARDKQVEENQDQSMKGCSVNSERC